MLFLVHYWYLYSVLFIFFFFFPELKIKKATQKHRYLQRYNRKEAYIKNVKYRFVHLEKDYQNFSFPELLLVIKDGFQLFPAKNYELYTSTGSKTKPETSFRNLK